MFVYELSGCVFESRCGHLNFRYHAFTKKIYSTLKFNIALLTELSLFCLPNKELLTIISLFSVKMVSSRFLILSKRVCLCNLCNLWIVFSTPLLQLEIGSTVSWKLCLNVSSFRQQNPIILFTYNFFLKIRLASASLVLSGK